MSGTVLFRGVPGDVFVERVPLTNKRPMVALIASRNTVVWIHADGSVEVTRDRYDTHPRFVKTQWIRVRA